MKKLSSEKMEKIMASAAQVDGSGTACFLVGAATMLSLDKPFLLYQLWPAIKYCWNS